MFFMDSETPAEEWDLATGAEMSTSASRTSAMTRVVFMDTPSGMAASR